MRSPLHSLLATRARAQQYPAWNRGCCSPALTLTCATAPGPRRRTPLPHATATRLPRDSCWEALELPPARTHAELTVSARRCRSDARLRREVWGKLGTGDATSPHADRGVTSPRCGDEWSGEAAWLLLMRRRKWAAAVVLVLEGDEDGLAPGKRRCQWMEDKNTPAPVLQITAVRIYRVQCVRLLAGLLPDFIR